MIEEIRARHTTTLGAAKELGRGLMRGNREEHKLGYSWENAAGPAARMFDLPPLDAHELKCYLLGFACGMKDVDVDDAMVAKLGRVSERFSASIRAGFDAGQQEPAEAYPAEIESAAERAERKRVAAITMGTCGCGATSKGECAAAVEGYFTSLSQRSEEQLRELAEGDECEAARVILVERRQAAGGA
jgi:hypothetical protein